MKTIKSKFENEIKTRINIISSTNCNKSQLYKILIKQGVFDGTDFINDKRRTIFPTEILCSSPKNNIIYMYLTIKSEEDLLKEIKNNVLNSIYEAYLMPDDEYNKYEKEFKKYKKNFCNVLKSYVKEALNSFYREENIETIFEGVDFKQLYKELRKLNSNKKHESLENKDEYFWDNYFNYFQSNFRRLYCIWMKMISKYYEESDNGQLFQNEEEELSNKYLNNNFKRLCNILYGINCSCALMIERIYIEIPSRNKEFLGTVYIDLLNDAEYQNIPRIIEDRICEDYKELFLIITNSKEGMSLYSKINERLNKVTLNKRIFSLLNETDLLKGKFEINETKIQDGTIENNIIENMKKNISSSLGISKEKIIVTANFKDIDKVKMISLPSHNDLYRLLKIMKIECENIRKVIKIKPIEAENIVSISLNQERMSVQALMGMLYDRYHGYLIELWNKIIYNEEMNKINNERSYSEIRSIIKNRKDDYKEYKYSLVSKCNIDEKNIIDFSIRNGDSKDSKKILRMLVNYGYNVVGFDSNENKIIVNINGEVSKEDKINLIKSVTGRLEEGIISYFENAFLMNISKTKFNTNNLYKALEIEKNITIDDFYRAFKEIFKKISDNIVRYEVYLK